MADTKPDKQSDTEKRFRLFLAAPVDDGLAQPLMESLRASQDDLPPLKPTPRENLHLTLAFLGDHSSSSVKENLIPRIDDALSEAIPGRIHFRQVAGFPSTKEPRYLALEGYGSPSALALREQLMQALADLLPSSKKSGGNWRPHVTLARLREVSTGGIEGTPWQVDLPLRRIVLYRSQRGLHGSVYTALHQWDLTESGE